MVSAKVWDANDDACPFCLAMDGKVVELGNLFMDKGQTQTVDFNGKEIMLSNNYLPMQGPPRHPNCRCDLVPQLIGE